jgi:hypothetical protein
VDEVVYASLITINGPKLLTVLARASIKTSEVLVVVPPTIKKSLADNDVNNPVLPVIVLPEIVVNCAVVPETAEANSEPVTCTLEPLKVNLLLLEIPKFLVYATVHLYNTRITL